MKTYKPIMKKFIFCSLTVLFSFAGNTQTIGNHTEFNTYVKNAVDSFELPGLTIAIVKEGEIAFENAYGYKDLNSKTALNSESVFAIASLSKAFTAAAIGVLVDEGKLNWTDRVDEYIPSFRLSDEYVASQLTIEDLLCHRSGFNTFDGDLLWYGTNYSREEIIQRFEKYKMSYDFRTKYGYQNIMFIIAGEVVKEVSGMSWEDFMEKRIFEPLEMKHSYATFKGFQSESNKALPHTKGELDDIRSYDNSGGAAAISSNVVDLTHWITMWLNGGIYKDDTLLSKSTHAKLLEMHTPIAPSSFDQQNGTAFKGYTQGWFVMNYGNQKVAYHGGGLPGYISKIFILPSEGIGGIILSNGETSLPTALMYSSIDEFSYGKSETDWAKTYLSFSRRYETYLDKKVEERLAMRGKSKSNIPESEILGEYEDAVYGSSIIEKKDGKLFVRLLPAEAIFNSTMEHWHQNTYRIKFKDKFLPEGFITFSANANGKVIGYKIDLPNPDFHFYNLDFKKVTK